MNYVLVIIGAMLLASLAVFALAVARAATLRCPCCNSKEVEETEDDQFRCLDCGSKWS